MKKIVLIVTVIFMGSLYGCFTPKNVESVKAPVDVTHYPENPLPLDYESYAIDIVNKTARVNTPSEKDREKYLGIKGFEKTGLSEADIVVKFRINKTESDANIKSEKHTKKVDGEKKTYKKYYYKIVTTLNTDMKVLDKNGNVLDQKNFMNGDVRISDYESDRYRSHNAAENAWENDRTEALIEANEKGLEKILEKAREKIATDYSYYKDRHYYSVYTFVSEDYDYSDIKKAKDKYKEAINIYSKEGLNEEVKKKLNDCIATWKTSAKEVDRNDKDAKINEKNIGYLYFNIALAYLWQHDFDKAMQYVSKAKDEKRNGMTEASLEDYIEDFSRNYKNYQQFKKKKKAEKTADLEEIRQGIPGKWQVYKIYKGKKVDMNGDNIKSKNAYNELEDKHKPVSLSLSEDSTGLIKFGEVEKEVNWDIKVEKVRLSNLSNFDLEDKEMPLINFENENGWSIEEYKDDKLTVYVYLSGLGEAKMYLKKVRGGSLF